VSDIVVTKIATAICRSTYSTYKPPSSRPI